MRNVIAYGLVLTLRVQSRLQLRHTPRPALHHTTHSNDQCAPTMKILTNHLHLNNLTSRGEGGGKGGREGAI